MSTHGSHYYLKSSMKSKASRTRRMGCKQESQKQKIQGELERRNEGTGERRKAAERTQGQVGSTILSRVGRPAVALGRHVEVWQGEGVWPRAPGLSTARPWLGLLINSSPCRSSPNAGLMQSLPLRGHHALASPSTFCGTHDYYTQTSPSQGILSRNMRQK